jgi:hypothetical protein
MSFHPVLRLTIWMLRAIVSLSGELPSQVVWNRDEILPILSALNLLNTGIRPTV